MSDRTENRDYNRASACATVCGVLPNGEPFSTRLADMNIDAIRVHDALPAAVADTLTFEILPDAGSGPVSVSMRGTCTVKAFVERGTVLELQTWHAADFHLYSSYLMHHLENPVAG